MATLARERARTLRLFLGVLGAVYFCAFASLGVQIEGLYGAGAILPAEEYLDALAARAGSSAWWQHPTLLWWSASDAALTGLCWAGAVAAVGLACGVLPPVSAALCWTLYLSLFQIGRVFLGFQWDILLLETGFLAIFVGPWRLLSRGAFDPEPAPVARMALWMLRWLLFRLLFSSGVVKLASGDPSWWDLGALEYHYWTQPLPTWTAWYAAQLPSSLQRASVAAMFAIELVVPWLVLGPRRARLLAFGPLVLLQVLIAATGNYTFFNLLTATLCLPLLDDDALAAAARRVRRPDPRREWAWAGEEPRWPRLARIRVGLAACGFAALATAGASAMAGRILGYSALPSPLVALVRACEPLRLTSSYGLFAAMTKIRREVVFEGSLDGRQWREYELPFKPGDVGRRPRFVAPHQPRLDWQLWFAALGDWRSNLWVVAVQRRLLDGSPKVLALFDADPFADEATPPRYVRAMLYDYRFTDAAERAETGAWWRRSLVGPYAPTLARERR